MSNRTSNNVTPISFRPVGNGIPSPSGSSASRGFGQLFSLHPSSAVLAILIDLMVFGGDAASLGALIPLGIVVAGVLGFIVYRIQSKWHGDDHETALTKALIVGLLTAIPVPLTPLVAIPGGIVGLIKSVRRK